MIIVAVNECYALRQHLTETLIRQQADQGDDKQKNLFNSFQAQVQAFYMMC